MNNLIKSRVHPLDAEAGAIFPPFRKKKCEVRRNDIIIYKDKRIICEIKPSH
jgi:hypothetical protein